MRKCLFLFFTLLSIFFITDSVYAESRINSVYEFIINGSNIIENNYPIIGGSSNSNTILVETNSSTYIPYYVIYIESGELNINRNSPLNVSVSGGCTYRCFSQYNSFSQHLRYANNSSYWAIVLPVAKSDCGVGTGNCLIDNYVTLSSTVNFGFRVVGVDAITSLSDLDSNSEYLNSINNIITSQSNNTQNIINNQNQNQQQTNQNLDNINNSLNDDSGVPQNDVSDKTNEWSSKLAGTGPVSNMVLMPITLLNGYINGFNSVCNSFNLGNFYGTDIVLPCIDISKYLGATLWNIIDILFSGFMIFEIGKKFVKIFNDFTNLKDNQIDDLYGGGK